MVHHVCGGGGTVSTTSNGTCRATRKLGQQTPRGTFRKQACGKSIHGEPTSGREDATTLPLETREGLAWWCTLQALQTLRRCSAANQESSLACPHGRQVLCALGPLQAKAIINPPPFARNKTERRSTGSGSNSALGPHTMTWTTGCVATNSRIVISIHKIPYQKDVVFKDDQKTEETKVHSPKNCQNNRSGCGPWTELCSHSPTVPSSPNVPEHHSPIAPQPTDRPPKCHRPQAPHQTRPPSTSPVRFPAHHSPGALLPEVPRSPVPKSTTPQSHHHGRTIPHPLFRCGSVSTEAGKFRAQSHGAHTGGLSTTRASHCHQHQGYLDGGPRTAPQKATGPPLCDTSAPAGRANGGPRLADAFDRCSELQGARG